MELITRRVIAELEGEGALDHLDEYCDDKTERYQKMVQKIGEKLDFTTLRYQTLDGMLEAIGLPRSAPIAGAARNKIMELNPLRGGETLENLRNSKSIPEISASRSLFEK